MLFPQHTFKENSIMANILPETEYTMRSIKNLSVESLRRVEGKAVLNDHVEVNLRDIRAIALHALKRLRRNRVPGVKITGHSWIRRKPVHVWLTLFAHDDLTRRLGDRNSQHNPALVRAEWKRQPTQSGYTFISDPDETIGRVRIRYLKQEDLASTRSTGRSRLGA
jgi:hypothetical protein